MTDNPYNRRFRRPKWNVRICVTDDYRIFCRLPEFQCWNKYQHEMRARALLRAATQLEALYFRTLRSAYRRYGDHGSLICCIGRDHFPEPVKSYLRMGYFVTELFDRAHAHWRASGRKDETFCRALVNR